MWSLLLSVYQNPKVQYKLNPRNGMMAHATVFFVLSVVDIILQMPTQIS